MGMDKLEKLYSISDIKFSSVVNFNSQIWLGLEVGFGYFNNGEFEHIVENGPYVASPDVISYHGENKFIFASKKGVSLSGWSNLSVKNYLKPVSYTHLTLPTKA